MVNKDGRGGKVAQDSPRFFHLADGYTFIDWIGLNGVIFGIECLDERGNTIKTHILKLNRSFRAIY